MCGQMRSDTVSLTEHSSLTSAYIHDQVRYSNVCAVRDEEAAGSNPATPTRKRQVTRYLVARRLHCALLALPTRRARLRSRYGAPAPVGWLGRTTR
jgi:hypothetical protein